MLGLVSGLRMWETIPSGLSLPSNCVEHNGKKEMSKTSLLMSAFKFSWKSYDSNILIIFK